MIDFTHMLQLPHSGLVSAGYQLGVDAGLTGDFDLTHIYSGEATGTEGKQQQFNFAGVMSGIFVHSPL